MRDSLVTYDRFLGGAVTVVQPARGYRAGMDAVLLAASLSAKPGESLAEAGSGAGAALMARRTERERRILALSGASADVGTRLLWRVGFAVVAPAAVALPLAVWATRPTARVDPIVAATGDGWTVALVAAIVLIALGIAVINIHPPIVLFGLFVIYGLSGYILYGWRRAKGQQTSVISTSTDEPEERGLHK